MNKNGILKFLALILASLLIVLPSCSAPTDEGSGTVTTAAPDTEGEETEGGDGSAVVLDFASHPVYKEKITEKHGSVLVDDISLRVNYESRFFGHDSAIDRDLVQYGWRFAPAKSALYIKDGFLGLFLGDIYCDAVSFKDGTVTFTDISVRNRRENETVFADENSKFSLGDSKTLQLPIGGELIGTGDFDGNGYTDLCIIDGGSIYILFLSGEKAILKAVSTADDGARYLAGDIDGDGICDLLAVEGSVVKCLYFDGKSFTEGKSFTLPEGINGVYAADINNDRRCDLVLDLSEEHLKIKTLFGLGDGSFGPPEGSEKNTNLYAEYENDRFKPTYMAFGDLTGDGICDILCSYEDGEALLVSRDEPAYDYSVFAMVRDGKYILYSGGRWFDQSDKVENSHSKTGDGDHVMIYHSDDGITFDRYLAGPAFYLGWEQGITGEWWSENTLEPEVIYIDGVYHMIWQCTGVTKSGWYGDRLGYASSTDGIHFERKTDSPIIVPSENETDADFDIEIGFNHEELIYVPDDPDGKCFWLYTGHYVNNNWSGYVRIRSSDPTKFCWDEREGVSGTSQIGNQIGYISDFDGCGNRLFLRISFKDYEDELGVRTCPFLQFSYDGIEWVGSEVVLASTDISDPTASRNKNTYFLGFATVDGTGELERTEDGRYKLMYYATTSNSPGGGEIWHAEIGAGEMYFTLEY